MIKQERPTWQEADDDDDTSDGNGYGSSKPARPAPSYTPPPRPQPAERPPVAPLEGTIIWQQNQDRDLWGKPKEAKGHEDDDDDEEDEDGSDASPQTVAKTDPVVKKTEENQQDADETPDVFVYPEDAVPSTESEDAATDVRAKDLAESPVYQPSPDHRPAVQRPEQEKPIRDAPVEAAQAHNPAPSAEVPPPYYRPAPNPAEATATYAQNPDNYERSAAQPPVPPANLPPETTAYAQPPERGYGYAYNPAMHPPYAANEYAPPARQEPNMPMEHAPADNHRHGEPLAAVVGIGLAAEHLWNRGKHKGHQKQMDRLTQRGAQQQKEASSYQMRTQEQQRSFTAEQQRQAAEMQRLRQTQERQFAAPASPYPLEQAPTAQYQQRPLESAPGGPTRPSSERPPQQRPEHMPPFPARPSEQQPEDIVIEAPALRPQQHVEHSAWHNIVVDKHGHEVHDAIHYGQEFYRQREHEMLQDRVSGSPTAGAGAAGGGGQQQGQPVLPPMYQQGTLPSGMTSPTLPPGHPTHIDPQHQLPAVSKKQSSGVSPWFWLMLALIVAAFFTAALI